MMFSIQRSDQAERDLEAIFRHLIDSYVGLGEELISAIERAEAKMIRIKQDIEALQKMPYQGTISPHLGKRVRHVTKERAILYFEVDDATRTIQLLAVFFSGQDHLQQMAGRFLRRGAFDA